MRRRDRASREPNLEERRSIVTPFDQTRFGLRGANDLPDDLGVRYGDRVACYIEGTCVDVIESTKREGRSERTVVTTTGTCFGSSTSRCRASARAGGKRQREQTGYLSLLQT